ncbi:MAG: helix-turn-helix domain-containing protein [Ruminococcus sp.]|nr:helix-turn-helix domain-containing protein [Ruminococcus sp.]
MDYLTVKQVAELKGCSERYIKQICKDGKIQAELQPHPQNKQPCYMIPVSALPEDLQVKYYDRLKKDTGIELELTEDKPEKPVKNKKSSRCFEELSIEECTKLNFWCELLKEWQSRRSQYKSKTEFDKNFIRTFHAFYRLLSFLTFCLLIHK